MVDERERVYCEVMILPQDVLCLAWITFLKKEHVPVFDVFAGNRAHRKSVRHLFAPSSLGRITAFGFLVGPLVNFVQAGDLG